MKIRDLLLTLVGLVISNAVPAFAQEQNTIDPEARQQLEAVFKKFQEAYNDHDAPAIAALWTEDAVEVRSWESGGGLHSGRQAIEKVFASDFASSPGKMVNEHFQVYPVRSELCAIYDTSVGSSKGRVVQIYVRDADTWKIRMSYVTF
jgi:ketosteroid isomerase-like protein